MSSFSITYPDLMTEGPIIEVEIAVPESVAKVFAQDRLPVPDPVTVKALVDTGADKTFVDSSVINYMCLRPHGKTIVGTMARDDVEGHYYHMIITLPGGNVYDLKYTVGVSLRRGDIFCIIGRDILSHGTLIYDGVAQKITFDPVPPAK